MTISITTSIGISTGTVSASLSSSLLKEIRAPKARARNTIDMVNRSNFDFGFYVIGPFASIQTFNYSYKPIHEMAHCWNPCSFGGKLNGLGPAFFGGKLNGQRTAFDTVFSKISKIFLRQPKNKLSIFIVCRTTKK